MDTTLLTLIWILVIGTIVGLLVWLGPRPSQWRSHRDPEDPEATGPENGLHEAEGRADG